MFALVAFTRMPFGFMSLTPKKQLKNKKLAQKLEK